jgi:hypothetical protein
MQNMAHPELQVNHKTAKKEVPVPKAEFKNGTAETTPHPKKVAENEGHNMTNHLKINQIEASLKVAKENKTGRARLDNNSTLNAFKEDSKGNDTGFADSRKFNEILEKNATNSKLNTAIQMINVSSVRVSQKLYNETFQDAPLSSEVVDLHPSSLIPKYDPDQTEEVHHPNSNISIPQDSYRKNFTAKLSDATRDAFMQNQSTNAKNSSFEPMKEIKKKQSMSPNVSLYDLDTEITPGSKYSDYLNPQLLSLVEDFIRRMPESQQMRPGEDSKVRVMMPQY